ncbi:hypothetical protein NUW54_g4051 [Trametes sanguinea]|uniref:Uncharacterized protein n=1 Tax=Trametes sanguinea TaxID=158606 RepID=A0ACC1Q2K6_9APHY|nr:hypothetical protein NUW54_g4051 [Trametes sanguinea]
MITLWNDPTIKALLRAQGIRIEDMPGFFLDSIARVTHPKYVPTDDDILRARLKTLGVSEHRFTIKEGFPGSSSRDLRIYDVGGHRSLRAAWAPFFDDMNAILFLAPLSGFDQVLAEDESVNRLEDSVLLWKSICSNPLLGKTDLILFLNKIDIFRAKLEAGIQFGQYIISYGNRPNDYDNTSAYMRRKFGQIHREYSPQARTFYCHFTTVTDTKSTSAVLIDSKPASVPPPSCTTITLSDSPRIHHVPQLQERQLDRLSMPTRPRHHPPSPATGQKSYCLCLPVSVMLRGDYPVGAGVPPDLVVR